MSTNDNFLTTGKSWKVEDLLQEISYKDVLLVLISVSPRHTRTGYLEEQNIWIKRLWNEVLSKFSDVTGSRYGWNTLFFAFKAQKYREVEKTFERILTQMRDENLKSFFISRLSSGNANKLLSDLLEIEEETASELNIGKLGQISARMIDGERLK